MALRASKPAFNVREKLTELGRRFGLKGSELAAAETVQEARDLVSAGRKNIIINGACMINQRFGSGTDTLNGNDFFVVDRFKCWASGGGQFTIQRSDNAPPGFKNSLMFTVSTADTSIASGDYYIVQQRVEGYNFAHLNWGTNNAKPVTLSFWVKADVTGKYGISFWPRQQNYNYVTHYNINAADTWEYKTITIPPPSGGSWDTDHQTGFGIWWDLGTGTNYQTSTTETWGQNNKFLPSDVTKMISTSGAKFRMTGVQLEVGRNATEFEHRSYGEELALCQRYYWRVPNARWLNGYKRHDNQCFFQLDTPVPMRASPTPTIHSVGIFTNHQSQLNGAVLTSNCTVFEYRPDSGRGTLRVDSTYTGTHTIIPSWEAGTIDFNAEL